MNLEAVKAVLRRDRIWSIYAIGDLAPLRLPYAKWFVNAQGTALVLLYAEFGTPILFACGSEGALGELLAGLDLPQQVYLHLRPEVVPLVEPRFRHVQTKRMVRMALRKACPADGNGVVPLTPDDANAVAALYADGAELGESPDFYFPQMLEDRTFFGVKKDGMLVAAAGTHITNPNESVAAVGNVYTHREWRNRGLGRKVTAAVVHHLQGAGFQTLALNVYHRNAAAIHVYESLGFERYCDFLEGEAR
jgi:ribosomal protein S18 acetylase RimI-like enzyme